ncbi:MAG: hypothetical protein RBS56_05065 [Candidatus Gracilibacteria bacterium]|jgi:hypothetical protein|nr:hypothetical protein [Candidatus Gracilibacteria bacterium]
MKKIAFLLAFLLISGNAYAYSGDLSISGNGIKTNKTTILEGQSFRIYSQISNNSNKDLLGVARFYLNNKQVGSDRQISVLAGKIDDVFVDTKAESFGTQKIKVQIFPWESENDNPSNNTAELEIKILRDTDRDGTQNEMDDDDDNDGVPDEKDAFPLDKSEAYDTDGDNKGNNSDEDDDNDGVPDEFDEMPLDPNETMDTDKDGIGNVKDEDDDNDGLTDAQEENIKTNPLVFDTDGDGSNDLEDKFPLNPKEQFDQDDDKIGNNEDTDDDNDGIPDEKDDFPLNKGPVIILSDENPKAYFNKDFHLDAKKSFDPDGKIGQIKWKIDGKTYFGEKLKMKFIEKGLKNIEIEITDNTGEKRNKKFQISVVSVQKYYLILSLFLTISLAMALFLKYISTAKKGLK